MTRTMVKLCNDTLGDTMARMRAWLDERRFEPDVFRYETSVDGATIRVEFKVAAEASAFANAFGGTLAELDRRQA